MMTMEEYDVDVDVGRVAAGADGDQNPTKGSLPRVHSSDFVAVIIEDESTNESSSGEEMLSSESRQRRFGAARRRRQAPNRSKSEGSRGQSKRMSEILASKTELYEHDPTQPEPIPDELAQLLGEQKKHAHGSGVKYWKSELETAVEHGGDYNTRLDAAIRAALGSFLVFSLLVLTHQQILGAVWIGNIFMHSSLKDSFGASLLSLHEFGTSIIVTTAVSWPAGYLLSHLTETQGCIVLPFMTFAYTFFIMSCPQLSSRNLMVLVMYLVVATNVREDIAWWEPFGWMNTYVIGLTIALLMNVFPRPSFALRSTHGHLGRLEKDLTMLLLQCKAYADNTASAPGISRAAVASIELLYARINKTVKGLKAKLPGSKVELACRCHPQAAADLEEWVVGAEKLLAPLKSLRTALAQRVLGEEYGMSSETLKEAKIIIKDIIKPSRDRMVDAMIASVAVCDAWADPSSHRSVLPDVQDELNEAIQECRDAFHFAMREASETLAGRGESEHANIAIFAHLTRRMSAFNALFEFADALLAYLKKHSWENEETNLEKAHSTSIWEQILGIFCCFVDYVSPQWLWHNPVTLRLAFKTSVGMAVASLWVSFPFLWNIAAPFGVWPGLTIASVNLANTGSSFQKAGDRLFGTLLAAAYALLVSDLFTGNYDYVKIPAISFFTFGMVYLRNSEHAYKYTYAATSIGSMLYGSVKNDFNISGYIPKRIELIFVGILIFSIIELMLFPRSSRKIVEHSSLEFFYSIKDFLKQAQICTQRMEHYVLRTPESIIWINQLVIEDTDDIFQLKKLEACHKKLKTESTKLKSELNAGLDEPYLGLSLPLHPESFRGLALAEGDCELQAFLLLKALKTLAKYCQEEGHPIRDLNWPHVHTRFLADAHIQAEASAEWLHAAYPDGLLRAQHGNCVKAVTAGATFRGYEDFRLKTISEWSKNYSDFIRQKGFEGSDPVAILTLGITTSFILELCRHLQKAGKHVEKIAHQFPAARWKTAAGSSQKH